MGGREGVEGDAYTILSDCVYIHLKCKRYIYIYIHMCMPTDNIYTGVNIYIYIVAFI